MQLFRHPARVCMTYLEHGRLSSSLGFLFLVASAKAFAHTIYPDVFISSSADAVNDASKIMKDAGCED